MLHTITPSRLAKPKFLRPRTVWFMLVVGVACAILWTKGSFSVWALTSKSLHATSQAESGRPMGDLYVLAVGVSDYREPNIRKLKFAAKDATDFGKLLQEQKGLFRKKYVKILTNEKATRRAIEKFLTGDLRRSGKDDTIILFFSGHGVFDPQRTQDFYFCPFDIELGYYAATAVKMSRLDFLEGLESKRVLLIADSCHAGGFSEWNEKDLPATLEIFLKDFRDTTGRVIITSAAPNQLSWELPEIDGKPATNSVFTHYLIQGLEGKADTNRDGKVTVSEAYEYSYAMTKEATGGHQHPQFEGRHSGAFPITLSGASIPSWKLRKSLMHAVSSGNMQAVKQLQAQLLDFSGVRDSHNRTPLLVAAAKGHVPLVELLLLQMPDLEARSDSGDTALLAAAANGRVAVVRLLLSKGADPNAKNKRDESALTLAARAGHTKVVELLLRAGANVRAINDRGNTALALAAYKGYAPIVRLLLAVGADPTAKDFKGRTPLSHAARYGHPEVVKILLAKAPQSKSPSWSAQLIPAVLSGDVSAVVKALDAGAKVDTRTAYGDTPLSLAAGLGYERVLRLLLDRGADVESNTKFGSTALAWAAHNGRLTAAEMLISHGATVDARDSSDSTPLTYAAQNNHTEIVRLLVEKGANVNNTSESGNMPLILAARNGNTQVVQLLLSKGAKVDATNRHGNSALLLACKNGHQEVVRLLLERDTHRDRQDENGNTSLMAASDAGHTGIVSLLLAKRAKVNLTNRKGETALFLAAKRGHATIVKALLSNGADPHLETREGISPRSVAEVGGHGEIVKLLERAESQRAAKHK